MANSQTTDQRFLDQAKSDALKSRKYGFLFLIIGGFIQFLHLLNIQVSGFSIMVIIAGVILIGSGILFIIGSLTVPQTRQEFIARLQTIMLDHNPERRLWAAQRLIGYTKEAKFSRKEVLSLAQHAVNIAKDPPLKPPYDVYIAGDHIILLREIAVSIPMNKHTRKELISLIRPLQKIKTLEDKTREILADAIAYHPNKLPIHAYNDLKSTSKEN